MRRVQKNAIYRHFKGNYYKVLDIGYCANNHEESNKKMVVYQSLADDIVYIRDLKEFSSPVDKRKYPDIKQYWRFEKININKALKLMFDGIEGEEPRQFDKKNRKSVITVNKSLPDIEHSTEDENEK